MKAFDGIVKADKSCGMAHWGRAMAMLDNPFVWPGSLQPAKLNDVAAPLAAARSAGLKSQREKDYVDARRRLRARPREGRPTRSASTPSTTPWAALPRYPDDKEASILSALITSANFDPADKNYANQLKAAQILEPLFVAQPDHPGVAHYLIHSYDYPPIADKGLAAAKATPHRARRTARAAHALAHLHARRLLAGFDQGQPRVRQGGRRNDFDGIMPRLHGLRASAAGRRTWRRARPGDQSKSRQADRAFRRRLRLCGDARPHRARARNWKQARRAWSSIPQADAYPWSGTRKRKRSTPSPAASAPRAAANTPGAKKKHARLVALRDLARGAQADATGRSRSTSKPTSSWL